MDTLGFAFAGIGAFLSIDSLLALAFGKRYMLWGLERMPASYRNLITRISALPAKKLFAIKLAEGAAGIALLWVVQ